MKKELEIDYLQLETYIINIESNVKAIDFCSLNLCEEYKDSTQNEAVKIILDNSIEKINENLEYLNKFVYVLKDYKNGE